MDDKFYLKEEKYTTEASQQGASGAGCCMAQSVTRDEDSLWQDIVRILRDIKVGVRNKTSLKYWKGRVIFQNGLDGSKWTKWADWSLTATAAYFYISSNALIISELYINTENQIQLKLYPVIHKCPVTHSRKFHKMEKHTEKWCLMALNLTSLRTSSLCGIQACDKINRQIWFIF